MRILYVTHFFPPEKGGAANRVYRITKELSKQGVDVEVLTGFPNYPNGILNPEYVYSGTKIEYTSDGIRIIRIPIQPAANSDPIWFRSLNHVSFVLSGLIRKKYLKKHYNVVIVSSPPLVAGILALRLTRLFGSILVLDVMDLWPESLIGVEGIHKTVKKASLMLLSQFAKYLYQRADVIVSPSHKILSVIQSKYNIYNKSFFVLPNGIVYEDLVGFRNTGDKKPIIAYAGLLGRMQDIDSIIELSKELPEFDFKIVGDGVEKGKLLHTNNTNLHYIGLVSWVDSIKLVSSAAFGIAFLRHSDILRTVVPSKIAEYAAVGTPILLNWDCEGASIVERYNAGIVVPDGDIEKMAYMVRRVWNDKYQYNLMRENAIKMAKEEFDMKRKIKEFIDVLLKLA